MYGILRLLKKIEKMIEKYAYKPYSNRLPELFYQEKNRILKLVTHTKDFQHIGSTAVVGLGGKGIIDIAILVDQKYLHVTAEQLKQLGYLHRENHSTIDRWYFRVDLPDDEQGLRRYHIHLMFEENEEWKNFILFRDYLKEHPDALKEYADLKEKIASHVGEDGARYRQFKDPFFKQIIAKAKS